MSRLGAFPGRSGLGQFIESPLGARMGGGLQITLVVDTAVCGCVPSGGGSMDFVVAVDGTYPLLETGRVGDIVTYTATGVPGFAHRTWGSPGCTGTLLSRTYATEVVVTYDESTSKVTQITNGAGAGHLFEWSGSVGLGVSVTNTNACNYSTLTPQPVSGGTAVIDYA